MLHYSVRAQICSYSGRETVYRTSGRNIVRGSVRRSIMYSRLRTIFQIVKIASGKVVATCILRSDAEDRCKQLNWKAGK